MIPGEHIKFFFSLETRAVDGVVIGEPWCGHIKVGYADVFRRTTGSLDGYEDVCGRSRRCGARTGRFRGYPVISYLQLECAK